MKKLIAILVVFAMIATAAFAEVNIGGGVDFGFTLVRGHNGAESLEVGDVGGAIPGSTVLQSLDANGYGFNFTWTDDEGRAGGKIKFSGTKTNSQGANIRPSGHLWWKPIDLIKIDIRNTQDEGLFGRGGNGWAYQSNDAADRVNRWAGGWNSFSNSALRSGVGFFGGTSGDTTLSLSLYPMDGLTVNWASRINGVAAPHPRSKGDVGDWLGQSILQATYNISGIGEAALSFGGNKSPSDRYSTMSGYKNVTAKTLSVDFNLTALDGMNISLGANIPLDGRTYENGMEQEISLPVEIGLGFLMNQWSGDKFQFLARAGAYLPSPDMPGARKNITAIGLDLHPSYDLGIFRAHLDAGFAIVSQKDNDTSDFFFHVAPYLTKGIGIGTLICGFTMWNGTNQSGYETLPMIQGDTYNNATGSKSGTAVINWALPIFFTVSF